MLEPTHLLDLRPVLGRLVRHLVDRESPIPDPKTVLSPVLMIQVPLGADSGSSMKTVEATSARH